MPLVPMLRTKYSGAALASALTTSLLAFQPDATDTMAAILLAHIYFETDNGNKLWNNNAGNTTTKGDPDNYWQAKGNALKFIAYGSIAEGIDDYFSFLRARRAMLRTAAAGDVAAFAQAVNDTGYTPGVDVGRVSDAVASSAAAILKRGTFAALPKGPKLNLSTLASSWGVPLLFVLVALWFLSKSRKSRR
jgi:hypothetical protein